MSCGARWNERVRTHFTTLIRSRVLACVALLSFHFGGVVLAQNCVVPPDGIQNWWRFEELTGTTTIDLVGGKTGTHIGGPTPVAAGKIGGALRFTGNSYVSAGDDDQWAFGTHDFTIELWAKFEDPGGSLGQPGDIIIGQDEGGGNTTKWWFALGNGSLHFHINSPASLWMDR